MLAKLTAKITFDHLIIAAAAMVGLAIGTHRIGDNSTFVHLRTGLEILNSHHVPRSDPYSFSAHGSPWIVQSWLPEVIYAALWKVGGGHLLQFCHMAVFATVAATIAWMARTGTLARTALVAVSSIGCGLWLWTERPTEFGLFFFVMQLVVITQRRRALWLVPIGALWVNSHGSWPLGIGWIVICAIGARLDGHKVGSVDLNRYLRDLAMLVIGVACGGLLSPAGASILTFPAVPFGSKADIFRSIAEWQAPNFHSGVLSGYLPLAALLAAVLVLSRRRQAWSSLLPILAFLGATLTGLRNFPVLGAALTPVMAATLRAGPSPSADPGDLRNESRAETAGFMGLAMLTLLGLVSALLVAQMFMFPPFNFKSYPVAGVEWLDNHNLSGTSHRVAAPDFVGCYRILIDGKNANVFIDDRYDMYPVAVATDALELSRLADSASQILSRYNFDAVLWGKNTALAQYLSVNPGWTQVWSDKNWAIFEPVHTH